ncbi:MAG: glycosyltransferase family 39 protein [Elusimicrobia bacterium]|nr:glycosyltransferase family 39 protein [Elusimicrobiota bacterium]
MSKKILIILLLLILAIQVILSSKQKCAYYDEPFQISAGLYHIKYKDFLIEIQNPPLIRMLSALPLLFTDTTIKKEEKVHWTSYQKFAFGKEFLYKNKISADSILFLARLQILGLSILLGLIIFLWARKTFNDDNCALFALAFYCFSPNILAHSGIAGTDLGVTFFIILALFLFRNCIENPSHINIILAGVAAGLALSSKFSAVLLIPIFIFTVLLKKDRLKNIINIVLIITASILVVTIVYFGSLGCFIEGIKNVFGIVGDKGTLTFLNGKYSTEGFRNYYVFAFLIKSTIPVIILAVISIILFKKIPATTFDKIFLLVPVIVFFAAASYSKTQIGLRYILPVYPLLFIYFSGLVKIRFSHSLIEAQRRSRFIGTLSLSHSLTFLPSVICYLLLVAHILCALRTYPHYLAYFNEFIGGPENGYKYLVDSNLDWGQDLKFLKKYLKGKDVNLIECYFGQGDTKYEGIKSQHILTPIVSDDVDYTIKNRKDLLAVSATYLQGLYIGQKDVFDWLKKRKHIANIGYSILVYDITNDADAHQQLGNIFQYGVRNIQAAKKEYMRARTIANSEF